MIHPSSTLRVTGPYHLVTLQAHYAKLEASGYVIEMSGESLIVEKLAEELAEITFEKITHIHIAESTSKGIADGKEKI